MSVCVCVCVVCCLVLQLAVCVVMKASEDNKSEAAEDREIDG